MNIRNRYEKQKTNDLSVYHSGFPKTAPRDTTAVAGENAFPTSPSEGELPVARQQPALAVTECKHCIL